MRDMDLTAPTRLANASRPEKWGSRAAEISDKLFVGLHLGILAVLSRFQATTDAREVPNHAMKPHGHLLCAWRKGGLQISGIDVVVHGHAARSKLG